MKSLFKTKMGFLSLILCLLAVVFGADVSMAMADTTGATPDEKGINTDLTGTVASGTQIREGELAEDEIDEYIAKFRPFLFPLETDIRKMAKQVPVKGYEIDHYASGASMLSCSTNAALAKTSSNTATLPVSTTNAKMFPKWATIYVPDVVGSNGQLVLFVENVSGTTVTVSAINPLVESGVEKIPAIPSGTTLLVCANACTESQMQVAPENYQPRPNRVYLQKKITNIVITDHWKEIAKKVPFILEDVKDNALYNHRRKASRTAWVGYQYRTKRSAGDTMGEEYVYFSAGVLRQFQSMYGIGNELTFADLIALTKMQFTDYSMNNEAEAYCGKDFMEKLLNIDFTKHKDVSFTSSLVMGIDIKAFKTSFGTLNFKWDPTLDDAGFSEYCLIADIKNAVRYVMVDDKQQHVDMKKGAGETREASRDIYTQIDAIALKGFNSILVGPSAKILGGSGKTATSTWATSASSLPSSNLVDGMVVYLTAAASGFPKGSLVTYNAATTAWTLYNGEVSFS